MASWYSERHAPHSRPATTSLHCQTAWPVTDCAIDDGALRIRGGSTVAPEETIAIHANAVWESGALQSALEILDQGIHDHPHALTLQKIRGDILAMSRNPREAVETYDRVLAKAPAALDIRWAKWSVLTRWGQGEESIAELRRMAQVDSQNPLVHLQLAQELRKRDRLEESLESYKQAVELVPDMLGWRLSLARARFDLLDYHGTEADVQDVLHKAPPGSPLELPARNLLAQIQGTSIDRGRRFDPVLTRDMTSAQRKEWAAIRAEAWRLFSTGHYQEAEPIYQRLLALNPKDPLAHHQLGLTLMQLGRCKDALIVFGEIANLDPGDEDYADTVFRMGQCLVELEQWEEAFVHFVIPASKIVRDDFPTGAHAFIPLSPGDSFPTTQQEIYLVFELVSSSYDAVPLTARCAMETASMTGPQRPVAQDQVLTTMNDQSGYFLLSPPETGWPVGLYHCGLFAGERTSADTLVDEVRFRIIAPPESSQDSSVRIRAHGSKGKQNFVTHEAAHVTMAGLQQRTSTQDRMP